MIPCQPELEASRGDPWQASEDWRETGFNLCYLKLLHVAPTKPMKSKNQMGLDTFGFYFFEEKWHFLRFCAKFCCLWRMGWESEVAKACGYMDKSSPLTHGICLKFPVGFEQHVVLDSWITDDYGTPWLCMPHTTPKKGIWSPLKQWNARRMVPGQRWRPNCHKEDSMGWWYHWKIHEDPDWRHLSWSYCR